MRTVPSLTCPEHGFALIEPDSHPRARDYTGPWCGHCEPLRCVGCGGEEGLHTYLSTTWHERVCNGCAANRLGV